MYILDFLENEASNGKIFFSLFDPFLYVNIHLSIGYSQYAEYSMYKAKTSLPIGYSQYVDYSMYKAKNIKNVQTSSFILNNTFLIFNH